MVELTTREARVPEYMKLQSLSTHLINEFSNDGDLKSLPDTLQWQKIIYLANQGYLGKNPVSFMDESLESQEYLRNLLDISLISQEYAYFELANSNITGNNFNGSGKSHPLNGDSGSLLKYLNHGKSSTSLLSLERQARENGIDIANISHSDGGYYLSGNINWGSMASLQNDQFLNRDVSLPYKLEMPKTDVKLLLTEDGKEIRTPFIENTVFNLYPRSNNKGNVVTILMDSYVTPLLGIFYYEIEITRGANDQEDVVIGFVKDEIKNLSYPSSSMVDMRGSDDRAVGWNGRNGVLTIWNVKRIEKTTCNFGCNDVVGMGYNLYNDSFFITKNGYMICELGSIEMFLAKSFEGKKNVKGLVPSISLGSYSGARVNLGIRKDDPEFKFDISNYVRQNKLHFMDSLKKKNTKPFKLPDNTLISDSIDSDNDLTTYIDALVLGYLKYGGHESIVQALEADLKDLQRKIYIPPIQESSNTRLETKTLLQLCSLKRDLKQMIKNNDFYGLRKRLEIEYPGFLTTYRKIDFRIKVVELIYFFTTGKYEIEKCIRLASQLQMLFKEEEFKFYVNRITVLFSFKDPINSPLFKELYYGNKTKINRALIMAINEQNRLPLVSPLDTVILSTDQNLESMKNDSNGEKWPLLINLLEDYIMF